MRKLALSLLVASALALLGCGAAVEQAIANGLADVGTTTAALSFTWTATTLTGSSIGIVNVPAEAQWHWTLNADGTFSVHSAAPLTLAGASRTYDELGTWRVVNQKLSQLGFTVTQTAGVAVPAASQTEALATYSLPDPHQLVLLTSALAPGNVRYIMAR